MSTLDIFFEKGRKEGFEQGFKEGFEIGSGNWKVDTIRKILLSNRCTIAEIASITNVTETFLSKVMETT